MDWEKRAEALAADMEEACRKHDLKLCVYDGRIGIVAPEIGKIVALLEMEWRGEVGETKL